MLRLLPALTLILASVAAVLPLGLPEVARVCAGFLPVMVAHYWCARRPQLLPVLLIFACGLVVDVLSHGPVGFWALLMLTAGALARLEEYVTGQSTAVGRAAVFVIAMAAVATLCWAIASAYHGHVLDGQLMLLAALAAVLAYPLVALLLMPIDRLWVSPRSHVFARGL